MKEMSRRSLLRLGVTACTAMKALGTSLTGRDSVWAAQTGAGINKHPYYKRIACEEAWTTAELVKAQLDFVGGKSAPDDPGLISMTKGIGGNNATQALLQDLGEGRIRAMDALGIDRQLLLLTSPGVQIFDSATGSALATSCNDVLADACRKHPDRFAGLTVIAPQDPQSAVKELERGMTKLGFKGTIVNSHIHGEYLDEKKYWGILEAAESLNAPIYIHPTTPPKQMIQDYLYRGLEGALAGFSHEVWLHTMALITSGALDRFPKLRIVVGHAGEGMPLFLYRFDYMQMLAERRGVRGVPEGIELKRKISDYMKNNLYVTTSGMAWGEAIMFCQKVLGIDHVLYAMDYPYQRDDFEVAATDSIPINYDEKKKLYQTNAERVFNL